MRVYVPATLGLLADYRDLGSVPAGTERLVAAEETEDAEYDALVVAAEASAALLPGRGRRVVVVAEVADPDAAFGLDRVRAVHADTEDVDPAQDDLPELGWFATQEIADLLR
ncbi:MAG: hypothetical protein J7518_20225 [Nocardioidaceae bacterium]|nr:hypothetical protein [Nocardioidaceae bacterium]